MPFFSIIIPAYNRAHLIGKTIEDVLSQSFSDFELIIADDGSTDDTEKVMNTFLSDPRIIYKKQNNKGVCAARNFGASFASGKYLVFLDSDDSVTKDWLNDFYALLNNSSIEVGFCNMKEIHADGSEILVDAQKPYANRNVQGKYIAGMFAIQKNIFDAVGGYDEHLKFGENTELGIRLRMRNVSMGFVNHCHFFYHVSPGGGGKNLRNKMESNIRIVEKHPDYFKQNPNTKKLFLQVAAVSAIKMGEYQKANRIFGDLRKEFPGDKKLLLQYLFSSHKWLAKLFWRSTNK